MAYRPTSLVNLAWEHPPRCLAGFHAEALKALASEHEAFAHFAVTCTCGNKTWNVLLHQPEPSLTLCPLTLKCTKCGHVGELFDAAQHGYDAELGNGCSSRRAEGPQVVYACRECSHTAFGAEAVFSYQFDEAEFDGDEEVKEKKQDIFDTFGLQARCAKCGHSTDLCDYELA